MGKIKKFTALNIRKITGGKDPRRAVEEFLLRSGFDPDDSLKENDPDNVRWLVDTGGGEELEVLLESLRKPGEMTVYLGVNVFTISLRHAYATVLSALEIADGLVGIKVSVVGHYLVLSATLGGAGITVDELDYYYRLIVAQRTWFKDALNAELANAVAEPDGEQ